MVSLFGDEAKQGFVFQPLTFADTGADAVFKQGLFRHFSSEGEVGSAEDGEPFGTGFDLFEGVCQFAFAGVAQGAGVRGKGRAALLKPLLGPEALSFQGLG